MLRSGVEYYNSWFPWDCTVILPKNPLKILNLFSINIWKTNLQIFSSTHAYACQNSIQSLNIKNSSRSEHQAFLCEVKKRFNVIQQRHHSQPDLLSYYLRKPIYPAQCHMLPHYKDGSCRQIHPKCKYVHRTLLRLAMPVVYLMT